MIFRLDAWCGLDRAQKMSLHRLVGWQVFQSILDFFGCYDEVVIKGGVAPKWLDFYGEAFVFEGLLEECGGGVMAGGGFHPERAFC